MVEGSGSGRETGRYKQVKQNKIEVNYRMMLRSVVKLKSMLILDDLSHIDYSSFILQTTLNEMDLNTLKIKYYFTGLFLYLRIGLT